VRRTDCGLQSGTGHLVKRLLHPFYEVFPVVAYFELN
jgi:hypothetical protein